MKTAFIALSLALLLITTSLHGQSVPQIQAEIVQLQAQVAQLKTSLASLTALQTQQGATINSFEATISTDLAHTWQIQGFLQQQITAVSTNPVLALGPYVKLNVVPFAGLPNNQVQTPTVIFSGVNLELNNGMGATNLTNGLGNLIVGYGEASQLGLTPAGWMGPLDRAGSHNLVLGRWNKWTNAAFSCIVAGELNEVNAEASSVLGGEQNTASGPLSVVIGGAANTTNGPSSVIVAGGYNMTQQQSFYSVILGGTRKTTTNALNFQVTGGTDFAGQ